MKHRRKISTSACACAVGLLVPALLLQSQKSDPAMASPEAPASPKGTAEVLLADYESGTLDSGVEGLTTTKATAPDASAVVGNGSQSSYAVQHKVTLDDPGYESNGAPRSESATDMLPNGRFEVGDEQRYEFSVRLKDWKPYESGDSESGDIVFQGKYGGGNVPAFYLMAKRNQMAFRAPHLNKQTTVVEDFRPTIDQWTHFRVDARWTTDDTGYFKVSLRHPGESDYTLVVSHEDVATYQPENPADHGYLKWGLYRPSQSTEDGDVPTRIVEHDDIRVLDLP